MLSCRHAWSIYRNMLIHNAGSFGGPDHAHGQDWTRMNPTVVVECCGNYDPDAAKSLIRLASPTGFEPVLPP